MCVFFMFQAPRQSLPSIPKFNTLFSAVHFLRLSKMFESSSVKVRYHESYEAKFQSIVTLVLHKANRKDRISVSEREVLMWWDDKLAYLRLRPIGSSQ